VPEVAVVFGGHSPIAIEISKQLSVSRKVIHFSRNLDEELQRSFEDNKHVETFVLPILSDGSVDIDHLEQQIRFLLPTNLVFAARFRGHEDDFVSKYKFEVLLPIRLLRSCSSISGSSTLRSAVLFCSPAGQRIVSDQDVSYHAHKAAIEQVIRFYAVNGNGIRVNGVSPGGYVLKDRNRDFYISNPKLTEKIKAFIPTGDFVTTSDISHLVEFLLSEKSRQINGQILSIDGGYSAKEATYNLI
jgi:Enoyl-(Acyl carrier protein) reductase